MTDQDNAVVPAQPTSTGLSLFQKLKAEQAKKIEIIPVETFVEHLNTKYGEATARKYFGLINVLKPADPGDIWRPQLIAICSQKGDRNVLQKVGVGNLYVHETKKPVPREQLFFPLFSHVEHAWWVKEGGQWKTTCRSVDGVKGTRFAGELQGQILQCGSSACPNTPEQFQKSTDQCKWGRALYLIDNQFSNIYQVPLKYFSIKSTYDQMVKQTKSGGAGKFDPQGSFWFTLKSFEKAGDKGEGWYFESTATDAPIKPEEAEIIGQAKALIEVYHAARVDQRDKRSATATSDMADLEAETKVEVNEEDGSSFVSM